MSSQNRLLRLTLGEQALCWQEAGAAPPPASVQPYAAIRSVHLTIYTVTENAFRIGVCTLGFASGETLALESRNRSGAPEERFTEAYRGFVEDLHRRLAAVGGEVRYIAGPTSADQDARDGCLIFLGGGAMLGLAVLIANTGIGWLWLLILGVGVLTVRVLRRGGKPGTYDPAKIPDSLMVP